MKKMRFIRSGLAAVLGMWVIALSTQAVATIKDTRHNLSNWGKYTVKATTETQVCIFCHAPHNADSVEAPLWNHKDTEVTTFQIASSAYIKPGNSNIDTQPKGISKKCLSCHDGTVAIGAVANGTPIEVGGGSQGANPGTDNSLGSGNPIGYRGTNLSGGHVISFVYNDALVTAINGSSSPNKPFKNMSAAFRPSMLGRDSKMHCHTCHDPHNDWCDDSSSKIGKDPLWRLPCGSGGQGNARVCEKCHDQAFDKYTAPDYPW